MKRRRDVSRRICARRVANVFLDELSAVKHPDVATRKLQSLQDINMFNDIFDRMQE